jgi:hypothetical protein
MHQPRVASGVPPVSSAPAPVHLSMTCHRRMQPNIFVTDEYIVTFVGTDEQVDLNSSELHSSIDSSVNQQIYTMFVGLECIFISFDR